MKKTVYVALALALPAFFLGGLNFNGGQVSFSKPAQANEEKKEEGKEGEAPAGPSYVEMKPLNLPIMDGEGISQTVSLVVSLEIDNKADADEAEKLKPRLTDAYIQDMYGALSKKNAMEAGVLQVSYIKDRLNKVTTKVLGKDKVKNVLLQIVAQRPAV